jgi:hypothetical protein
MSAVLYDEVLRLARQLSADERAALIQQLQATLPEPESGRVTRDMMIVELEHLRATGAFENVESLRNKYADPPLTLSDEELNASLHEIASEWEEDIDSLFGND